MPMKMREEMLRKLHSGHQGIVKTVRRSRDAVWWPSLNKEVKEMVESCNICIKNQRMRFSPLKPSVLPEGPWEEVGTDLFEFEGKWYAIFIDYYSRWIETVEMRSQTGDHLVNKLKP